MQSTTTIQSVTFTRGESSLILDHGFIMYILGLLCNVVTLALNVATLQRRDVSTSRRQFDPSLECRDVRSQHRDVGLDTSLQRRDVRSQRRDFGFEPLWNVATLDINVATLVLHLLQLRDVGYQRRDVDFYHSLARHDIGSQRCDVGCFILWNVATLHPNVATLPCLRPKITFLFALTLLPLGLNPSAPCVTFPNKILPATISIQSEAIVLALRHHHRHCHHQFLPRLIVHCPCLAPSTLSVGVLASVRVRYSIFDLVLHLRFRVRQLGLSYVLGLVSTSL